MTKVLLFHHAHGLTDGVREFADDLTREGHTVHLPDLYDGNVFTALSDGIAYAQDVGVDTIVQRGVEAASGLPDAIVYAGFSLGVMPAQRLAQTRPGAAGALLFEACLPVSEFGDGWPTGVPVQIHGMDDDEFFVQEGDIDAARALAASTKDAELFTYPGSGHLFADRSLDSYDETAARTLIRRTLAFLAEVGP